MSLEESLLEEVLKEEETPVAPTSGENPDDEAPEDGNEGNGNGNGDDNNDEGGRPLPIIPPGGPLVPPTGE